MLAVISPAKTLDFETKPTTSKFTIPEMLNYSEKLAGKLRKLSPEKISGLMGISPSLAELNFERFRLWSLPFTPENAKQAILAFNGDVYDGLDASSFSEKKLFLAQQKLRILSGLYGVLRPLDLIQPYRLEMGTKIGYDKAKNLYEFWRKMVTESISNAIKESGSKILVNLASHEYFKSIDTKKIDAIIITPAFKNLKNGNYKIITFYAKKARGLMTRFIIDNNIDNPEDLQAFEAEGYNFNPRLSGDLNPVFTRG